MNTAIVWFRRDLRLADNPALLTALETAESVIPVYIYPDGLGLPWSIGSASRWWLHHSLAALDGSLREMGSGLVIRRGEALASLRLLAAEAGASQVFWNRLYEPAELARDTGIKQALREDGLTVASFNAALLYEPWELRRAGGEPYRVFTPYWKAMQSRGLNRAPEPGPEALPPLPAGIHGDDLHSLNLLPRIPWDREFHAHWRPGEGAARERLRAFAESGLAGYPAGRDLPGQPGTSRLSPHLHFGEISPRQILGALLEGAALPPPGAECFVREIAWREFAHQVLFHFPRTTDQPLDERFQRLPWRDEHAGDLRRWQQGLTGFPIVDAGLRELWRTGWMHNRVRMVAASWLSKNLLIPWREGARWFWDTLVDADLANNTLGWQWAAGCGADAAPFFRLFNPVLQGRRFDSAGDYVRRWVPELARLPAGFIHQPWAAGETELAACGVRLGEDYPRPMVDLKGSRERALAAWSAIRNAAPASRP